MNSSLNKQSELEIPSVPKGLKKLTYILIYTLSIKDHYNIITIQKLVTKTNKTILNMYFCGLYSKKTNKKIKGTQKN